MQIDADELWDEFSEHIDDDIDSLSVVAGSSVITKSSFQKMMQKIKLSTDAVYAIEVPQNKLYQLYTKEQIINAHMAGQRNAGVDPSYSAALEYYEQEKKDV